MGWPLFFAKNSFFYFFLHIVKSRLHPANCNLKQELENGEKRMVVKPVQERAAGR